MEWEMELIKRAQKDEKYQQMLQQVRRKEMAYLRIKESLNSRQRNQLDAYISSCEELDYCLVRLAFYLGREGK